MKLFHLMSDDTESHINKVEYRQPRSVCNIIPSHVHHTVSHEPYWNACEFNFMLSSPNYILEYYSRLDLI